MPTELASALVAPEWLAGRLGAEDLRLIDATWYLPSEGRDARREFEEGHIPGAVWLDLSTDLADPTSGRRNTLAAPGALARAFEGAGIGSDHAVVVYDRRAGYSAGRLWWTLRYLGHERVALLDGGFPRWEREGRPVAREPTKPGPARFDAKPQPRWLADKAAVLASLGDGRTCIVDARSPARFRGEGDEPAQRAGHIPGSVNVPWGENSSEGAFRDIASLRNLYESVGVRLDRPVITTCGSGVTAALDAFALTLIGHDQVAVYDGSWDEWGNSVETPVEPGG